jgi:putative DNA primase/helicase
LWVAFSWLIESVRVAPIALITAPEKRCGKSVLLNTIAKLVPRPMPTSGITASALFRVIEMHKPTLLIDEVDVVLKDNEALRGVLNSGHTRDSATLIRSVGEDHSPRQFSTWGAKLIAGISADLLADTVTDRAIVLELRRKTKIESVERLRHADAMLFYNLKRKLARWTADNAAAVSDCTVNIPDELSDRAQDNWEPLLAIADAAGGHWPRTARETAVAISARNEEATGTAGTELLASVWRILETRDDPRIPMSELLTLLLQEPEGRWSQYDYGRSLTVHQLGRLLKKYGIKSKTIRFGANTEKGYDRHQFVEVVLRYLPHLPTNKENGLPDNPVTLVT